MNRSEYLATRRSLVERLADWKDSRRWQEFFDGYWKLIHTAARRAGLTEAEAQEAVQETLITVAKKIEQFQYDPALGSFKGWLLNITRWRIADQFRKRQRGDAKADRGDDERAGTRTIERIADPAGVDLDAAWDEEWRKYLLSAATERVKNKIDPKQYQIFDCYVLQQWPARKVAAELRVNIAQVYLIKHRVAALLRRETESVERARVRS
jgi:RNA polymerase sigma factor (sigma-70 family)